MLDTRISISAEFLITIVMILVFFDVRSQFGHHSYFNVLVKRSEQCHVNSCCQSNLVSLVCIN